MTKAEQPTITQADRVISWEFRPHAYQGNGDYIRWMKGTYDNCAPVIQAFARHRTPSLAAQDGLVEDAGVAMLMEGAQDAVDAFKTLRIGMLDNKAAIEVIDAHIDELEYALSAIKGDKS